MVAMTNLEDAEEDPSIACHDGCFVGMTIRYNAPAQCHMSA